MKNLKFVQFDNPEERFNRTVSILIIITMTFLIFYFVSLSWFGESDYEGGVITVGNIAVSVSTDLNFSGIYLEPNKTYSKQTTIIGSSAVDNENTNDAYIKVKLVTNPKVNGENIITPVYNTSNWVYDGSEWYYYIGFINKTTSATFNTALKVNNNLTNELQNQELDITLTVYAIQRDFEAHKTDNDWKNAPTAWKTAIAAYDTTN